MLTVNGRFLTQRITGSQRYAYEVTRCLISMRGEGGVQVFMPRHETSVPDAFTDVTRQIGRLRGHLWEQLELGRRVNIKGDVLWSPVNVGPVLAKNHVVTIHDVFSVEFPSWVGRKFHLWYSVLLPRIAVSAHHIITDSEYSKERIVEVLGVPEDKVSVVHLGVDADFRVLEPSESEPVRRKYNLPENFILTLGSLEPRKNLERVVDAWLQSGRAKSLPLIVAGGLGSTKVFGHYDADKLRLHKNIRLLGYVPEEDLAALYSMATVFIYASLLEGFGLPPLEALACGSTVVTSNTSAMKETSEGVAFLVNPHDVCDITSGIEQALERESGRTSANRERQSEVVKEKFDWTKTTHQIEKVLQKYE